MRKYKVCLLRGLPLFLAVLLLLTAGCGKEHREELTLVTEPPFPPFEYYSGDELTGVDIDIMQEIARRLGYDLKIQPISFDMVLKSVASGYADVAMAGITITKEREKLVNFSVPYITVHQVVMVPAQSRIRRVENLQGKLIGVQADTTGEEYVKAHYENVVSYPNIEVGADALASGKIDALILDSIPAEDIAAKDPYFRLLPEKLTWESYGIAVNKNKKDLLKKINVILGDMLRTGWVSRAVKRHTNYTVTRRQEAIQGVRQMKIGIVPAYPPYEMKKDGILEGIDVDIINRICDELGYLPSFVEIGSDTVYQSVSEDDVTVCISSLSITEDRKKLVNFSIPYSEASQQILVKKQSAFQKKDDLKGKTLGVVSGTTSEEQGRLLSNLVECYSEPNLLLEALSKGNVDAVVLDDFILKQMTRHSDEFRILPDILVKEEYGIAVSKNEPELLERINMILQKMKQDGSLARIHEKYIPEKARSTDNGQNRKSE